MPEDEIILVELMLNRFRRLMAELRRGVISRTEFEPWELELLVDLQSCDLDRRRALDLLRQYQRAVEKQLETGPGPPMKLSEFLLRRAPRCHEPS